jgi:hypothetical protein
VNSKSNRLSARSYVIGLAASGRYHFTSREARAAIGVSAPAAKLALNRLAKQRLTASPARGFYVILSRNMARSAAFPLTGSSRR